MWVQGHPKKLGVRDHALEKSISFGPFVKCIIVVWVHSLKRANLHYLTFIFTVTVSSVYPHTCFINLRRDQQTGKLRWALPSHQRCLCDKIIAAPFLSSGNNQLERGPIGSIHDCPFPFKLPKSAGLKWWYVDDPFELIHRKNWNTTQLAVLLGCQNATESKYLFRINCVLSSGISFTRNKSDNGRLLQVTATNELEYNQANCVTKVPKYYWKRESEIEDHVREYNK